MMTTMTMPMPMKMKMEMIRMAVMVSSLLLAPSVRSSLVENNNVSVTNPDRFTYCADERFKECLDSFAYFDADGDDAQYDPWNDVICYG